MTNYEQLGKHIQTVDIRNSESITDRVLGINIDKYFMPSVANVIGTDLSNYKLLHKGLFACNPMHVGRDERLPVALYTENEPAIISPAYFMFELVDPKILNPEYLMMWFRRPEFDRLCWLKTDGSVRGGITWDDICRLEVPVIPIEDQLHIAKNYSVISERIKIKQRINDNLEEQAQAIYSKMFIEEANPNWPTGKLSDIANITMGQSPKGDTYNEHGIGTVFFQGRAEFGFRFPQRRLYTTDPKRMAQVNDVLLSVRAPVGDLNVAFEPCCIGRGLSAIHSKDNHQSFVLYTVFSLRHKLDMFNGEGTVFGSINRDSLNSMEIILPPMEVVDQFENTVSPMDFTIRNNFKEISQLEKIRDNLLPLLLSGELDVSEIEP